MKKHRLVIDHNSCSVVYFGKNTTKDRTAIIARTDDGQPLAILYNLTIHERDAFKNKFIKGVNGFTYRMPSKTYRYISTPINPCCNKGNHWDSSAINENAVGFSATLTCHTNRKALRVDPFVKKGIGEDDLTHIPAALARSARHAMEVIASIIDKSGINEPCAVFAIDQKETWYMEAYTGHQYIAVQLPDDKVFTVGNEFILSTLFDMKPRQYFTSKGLFTLPTKYGFAQYQGPHNKEHMDLALTYGPTPVANDYKFDNSRRRTWIGYRIFAPHSEEAQTYIAKHRYPPFVTPERNDLTIHDMIKTLRNRFEQVIDNPKFKEFKQDLSEHHLRLIGGCSGLQIHAIRSYANLPKEIACQQWLSFANSNFAPFLPINNGIQSIPSSYAYKPTVYDYDENSTNFIYKRLCLLGHFNWKCYGDQINRLWEGYEAIWDQEYQQVINEVKALPLAKARARISEYTNYILEEALDIAKYTYHDLLLHMMNYQNIYFHDKTRFIPVFYPLVNLNKYVKHFNWTLQQVKPNQFILKKNNDICIIKVAKPVARAKGTLTYKNKTIKVLTRFRNNELYVSKNDIDNVIKLKDINTKLRHF
ncbi:MAG: C69 family dipeptidase [Bacilli bacterium]|nr:C69 family dipeptidase [Bacilli bacterium]